MAGGDGCAGRLAASHAGETAGPGPGRGGAEGANPPRNLSGKRTAWAGDSEVGVTSVGMTSPVRQRGRLLRRPLLGAAMTFASRHIGPDSGEQAQMLKAIGYASLDALMDAAIP